MSQAHNMTSKMKWQKANDLRYEKSLNVEQLLFSLKKAEMKFSLSSDQKQASKVMKFQEAIPVACFEKLNFILDN